MPSSKPTSSPIRTEIAAGIWLDGRLGLWISSERLLVVADLHWGYAASHRARGNLVPMWGDDEIEQRLDSLLADYDPAEMLLLGDIVHAAEGGERATDFLRRARMPVTLIGGNHDRRWPTACLGTAVRGNFFFHHGDQARSVPAGHIEVVGHHHPAFDCGDGAGSRLKIPALVSAPRRLILPAFSPWSAGTAWNYQLQSNETLWAVAPTRIFAARTPLSAAAAGR